jgi:hypothetical protein
VSSLKRRLKHGPGDQRGLLTAGAALEDLARSDPQDAVVGFPAVRAVEPLWPANLLEGRRALLLGPELF